MKNNVALKIVDVLTLASISSRPPESSTSTSFLPLRYFKPPRPALFIPCTCLYSGVRFSVDCPAFDFVLRFRVRLPTMPSLHPLLYYYYNTTVTPMPSIMTSLRH